MPCFHPVKGWASKERTETGKRKTVYNRNLALLDKPREHPCGQCIWCRLQRSKENALKCVHEASLWEQNCFITLTYSPENLPKFSTLKVSDFQKFMKRLRFHENGDRRKKFIGPLPLYKTIRYYHCGEYGERRGRPHYHSVLFNHDFKDRYPIGQSEQGFTYYRSPTLEKLWPLGNSMVSDFSFETAAYIARYITKKVNGWKAEQHYEVIDIETGECVDRKPEYASGSQSIGRGWLKKFKKDILDNDFCYLDRNGRLVKVKVPKSYDKFLELENPEEFLRIKAARCESLDRSHPDLQWERLRVREEVQLIKYEQLTKKLE